MTRRAFSHSRAGSVLIVVLWICLSLVAVTLLFGQSAMMSYRAESNEIAGRQAEQAIEGGLRYVEYLLANSDTPGGLPANTDYVNEAVPVGQGTFWIIGRGEDTDYGVTRVYGITDEAGKININTAGDDILQNLGFTADQSQSIQDWRLQDSSTTTGTGSTPSGSSTAKGGPFESVEELALIGGMDLNLLNGEDANFNGFLDPNENDGDKSDPPDNSDGKLDAGILEWVTAFSIEPELDVNGVARTKITTLTPAVMNELSTNHPGVTLPAAPAAPVATGKTGTTGAVAGVTCSGPLDFLVKTGMNPDDFDKVYADMRMEELQGKINVNTATQSVLSRIPGLETRAADLVSARLARTQPDSSLSWVRTTLGDDTLVSQIAPYLTGRTYQVSADIAAVGQNGRGYRRTRFVIDLRTGSPRVIYRKNFTSLGWALGPDVRLQWTGQLSKR